MAAVAEYRTPLPGLLAAGLEAAINQYLALDENAVQHFGRLDGKALQVDLDGLGISLYLGFAYGSVEVNLDPEGEPATRISGTPVALFLMAAPESIGDWGLPGSGVRIEGDANLARDIGRLFSRLDADWQAPFNALFGRTMGQQVSGGLRQGADALRDALVTLSGQAREYRESGGGLLVSRPEAEDFARRVGELRDAVDRLEARVRHRTRQQGGEA